MGLDTIIDILRCIIWGLFDLALLGLFSVSIFMLKVSNAKKSHNTADKADEEKEEK